MLGSPSYRKGTLRVEHTEQWGTEKMVAGKVQRTPRVVARCYNINETSKVQ